MKYTLTTTNIDLQDSFKAYDVRGVVGENINSPAAEAIGAAFVEVLDLAGKDVLVGGDMRPSSKELSEAFARGAIRRGANVVKLGLISTDELYLASGKFDASGVVFTASHNPAQYNGIKMSMSGARPVSSDNGLFDIRDLAQTYLDEGYPEDGVVSGSSSEHDVLQEYACFLRELVDLTQIRNLKVVVDAGNGMAGLTAPAVLGDKILESLPLEIIPLYFELDGTFPNHPANPLEPENLKDLQSSVIKHEADLGLAFDGDADRCFVIDERGLPLSPSAITALVATREIRRAQINGESAAPVVIHNLITSKAVPEFVEAAGGKPLMTRVGHSFIKAEMAKHGAIFGGEHSAHYYFKDFFNADTGMLAAMHVLAALGEQNLPLSELGQKYEPYFATGEINSVILDKSTAVERVKKHFESSEVVVTEFDGTTFSAQDNSWWFNLRPSNTEPFLRFNGEGQSEDIIAPIRDLVLNLVRDATSPFGGK